MTRCRFFGARYRGGSTGVFEDMASSNGSSATDTLARHDGPKQARIKTHAWARIKMDSGMSVVKKLGRSDRDTSFSAGDSWPKLKLGDATSRDFSVSCRLCPWKKARGWHIEAAFYQAARPYYYVIRYNFQQNNGAPSVQMSKIRLRAAAEG
jgi:hypothetical protein